MDISWAQKCRRKSPDYSSLEQRLLQLLQRSACDENWEARWKLFLQVKDLVEREVGPWANGWCWGEIDGGPVRRWCCFDHSFLQGKAKLEPALTVAAVLNGLRDWELNCEQVDSLFLGIEIEEPVDLDIAVLEIVNFAVKATGASDAWYGYCLLLLKWFLECRGIDERRAQKYARKAIGGRFESWSEPSEKLKEDVAESFRLLVWKKLGGK